MSGFLHCLSVEPLITLHDVAVAYGDQPVLRNIDMTVNRGEVVALRGPNGAGKSTLLRVFATLLRPAGGTGHVLGAELGTSSAEAVRPRIGLVAHQPALYSDLTLLENLELIADLAPAVAISPSKALELVGLAAASQRRVSESSQGMVRRADLARLLVTEPELLLLDEPHSGLDQAALGLVDNLVRRCIGRSGAVVVVSHLTHLGVAERSVTIDGGTVAA